MTDFDDSWEQDAEEISYENWKNLMRDNQKHYQRYQQEQSAIVQRRLLEDADQELAGELGMSVDEMNQQLAMADPKLQRDTFKEDVKRHKRNLIVSTRGPKPRGSEGRSISNTQASRRQDKPQPKAEDRQAKLEEYQRKAQTGRLTDSDELDLIGDLIGDII